MPKRNVNNVNVNIHDTLEITQVYNTDALFTASIHL